MREPSSKELRQEKRFALRGELVLAEKPAGGQREDLTRHTA